jgi:SAM-dependent methyltransferase
METPALDVPSPIDLQQEADAKAWAAAANEARPWRTKFFETIASAICADRPARILELGSGPGFLADHILGKHASAQMVLLDFSEPMHKLASERLQAHADRVTYVCRSFKSENWKHDLGTFDYVVTNQAVHELRHKRYAVSLHVEVRSILREGGCYLVSDHYFGEDGMKKEGLYMTVSEQREAFASAGFNSVSELLRLNGMVLHSAA